MQSFARLAKRPPRLRSGSHSDRDGQFESQQREARGTTGTVRARPPIRAGRTGCPAGGCLGDHADHQQQLGHVDREPSRTVAARAGAQRLRKCDDTRMVRDVRHADSGRSRLYAPRHDRLAESDSRQRDVRQEVLRRNQPDREDDPRRSRLPGKNLRPGDRRDRAGRAVSVTARGCAADDVCLAPAAAAQQPAGRRPGDPGGPGIAGAGNAGGRRRHHAGRSRSDDQLSPVRAATSARSPFPNV